MSIVNMSIVSMLKVFANGMSCLNVSMSTVNVLRV
jgi:hypothetical protein